MSSNIGEGGNCGTLETVIVRTFLSRLIRFLDRKGVVYYNRQHLSRFSYMFKWLKTPLNRFVDLKKDFEYVQIKKLFNF